MSELIVLIVQWERVVSNCDIRILGCHSSTREWHRTPGIGREREYGIKTSAAIV